MRLPVIVLGTALFACGNGGSSDAGSEAGLETGTADGTVDSPDEQTSCMTMLCVHGDQPMQCPSCSPSNGDICSPPAAVTCTYDNGCSGAARASSQCTCELPDAAADSGDAGSMQAIWSCSLGM